MDYLNWLIDWNESMQLLQIQIDSTNLLDDLNRLQKTFVAQRYKLIKSNNNIWTLFF